MPPIVAPVAADSLPSPKAFVFAIIGSVITLTTVGHLAKVVAAKAATATNVVSANDAVEARTVSRILSSTRVGVAALVIGLCTSAALFASSSAAEYRADSKRRAVMCAPAYTGITVAAYIAGGKAIPGVLRVFFPPTIASGLVSIGAVYSLALAEQSFFRAADCPTDHQETRAVVAERAAEYMSVAGVGIM